MMALRDVEPVTGKAAMRLTDAQLLTRFAEAREEEAFAALVQRHGPMVLGVCRRMLQDSQEAEDAFQATFLVLARRALAIRDREAVASWLYGVASRMAAKLRCQAGLRREKEKQFFALQPAQTGPDLLSFVIWQELRPVLDEELGRLPEKYRSPLVLCYLEGKSHDEAAAELGWPKGSMSRRMDKARTLLRQRLAQRGISLSVGVIFGVLGQQTTAAALPAPLAAQTLQAAVAFAAKPVAVTGVISPTVASLAQGALHTMSWSIGKFAAGSLLTLALLSTSAGLLSYPATAQQPPSKGTAPAPGVAKGEPVKPEKPEKTVSPSGRFMTHREVHHLLNQPSNYFEKGYRNNETLDSILRKIADDFKVTIRFNRQALSQRANLGLDVFEKTEISLPETKEVSLRQVLRELLAQVPSETPLTFVVRGNQIVIEPQVNEGELLSDDPKEPPLVLRELVSVTAEEKPLREVLRDLADNTGANIVLDSRLREQAQAPVTVSLQNVPLVTAVRLLADMAEVRTVIMDNVLYVTTVENAAKLERERQGNTAPAAGAGVVVPPTNLGGAAPAKSK